jgi:hypothetical protein
MVDNIKLDLDKTALGTGAVTEDTAGTWTPLFSNAKVTIVGTAEVDTVTLSNVSDKLKLDFGAKGADGSSITFDGVTFELSKISDVGGYSTYKIDATDGSGNIVPLSAGSNLWTKALDALSVKADKGATSLNDTITVNAYFGAYTSPTTPNVSATDVVLTNGSVPCFYPGTLIRTPRGEVAVETLKHGDLVLTHDGREIPVAWLGRQTVSTVFADKLRVLPIRIKAGALGENVPVRDLLVSPDHAMFVAGVLIHAGALVNDTSIVREANVPTIFTYFHVEVADHSLILAEGAPAETFVDNVDRLGFDNWNEYEALYPEGRTVEEMPYPRAKARRQVPVSIRVALAARAEAIGEVTGVGAVA